MYNFTIKEQISNYTWWTNVNTYPKILRQVCNYLAKNCDYASSKDGIGFNGIDTHVGHSLAILEDEYWKDKLIHNVANMLLKYKKQILKNNDLDYEKIREIYEQTKEFVQNDSYFDLHAEVKQKKLEQQKKYGKKELCVKNGLLCFEFDKCFIDDVLSEIKDIQGRIYSPKPTPNWSVPTHEAITILNIVIQHKFSITSEAFEILSKELEIKNKNITASGASSSDKKIIIKGLYQDEEKKLLPYQIAGIHYLIENPDSIVADEPGLGKTLQTIATVQKLNAFPALIIVPGSLAINWEKEFKLWLPRLSNVQILKNGNTKINKKANVIIVSYDLVKKFQKELQTIKFKALICDESHNLKNYKAQRTIAVTELSQILKPTLKTKLLLSGTPIMNRPRELISQLQIIDKINIFGGAYDFLGRYCYSEEKSNDWNVSYDGAINLDELNRKLREACFLRREKIDVLTELPPKRRIIRHIFISNKREYKRAENDLINFIGEKAKSDKKFYASITHLSQKEQQIEIDKFKNKKESAAVKAEILVKTTTLRKVTGEGKIKEAIQWIEDFLQTDQKLIVFGVHSEVLNTLAKHLLKYGVVMVTGEQSMEERDKAVQQFQENDKIRLFIGSIKAAGVGFTLTKASNVLFVELEWRPGDHEQAEDRAHRIGQKDSVTAWYLIDDDTIDKHIYQVLEQKRQIIKQGTKKIDTIDYSQVLESIDNKKATELSQYTTHLLDNLEEYADLEEITELSQNAEEIKDISKHSTNVECIDTKIEKSNQITELSQNEIKDDKKEKNRLRMQNYRRKKGMLNREEYLKKNQINKNKPWVKMEISRANYYRNIKKEKDKKVKQLPENLLDLI